MEFVCHTQLGHTAHAAVQKVAAARHHKADIVAAVQNLAGSLYKVFGALLQGDAAKEGDNLFLYGAVYLHIASAREVHCIVHCHNLCGIYAVTVHNNVAGPVTHCDNPVGSFHTALLYVVDEGVVVLAVTVKLGGVNVYYQRLAAHFLGGDAGQIGEPVVGVDHVKVVLCGNCASDHCIAGHLLVEVGAVLAGEFVFAAEVGGELHCLEVALLFAKQRIIFRRDVGHKIAAHTQELNLVQIFVYVFERVIHGNVAGVDNAGGAGVFVSAGRGHHEQRLNAVGGETLYYTVAGGAQTAGDVGRKLPAEHQYFHCYTSSLYLLMRYSTVRMAPVAVAELMAPCG